MTTASDPWQELKAAAAYAFAPPHGFFVALLLAIGVGSLAVSVVSMKAKQAAPRQALPDVVDTLTSAKSSAEGQARVAQEILADEVGGPRWRAGRIHYDAARTVHESGISYLKAALFEGFSKARLRRVEGKLHEASMSLFSFTSWCDSLKDHGFQAVIVDASNHVAAVWNWMGEAERWEIEKVAEEVERCRWKTWDELAAMGQPASR